MATEFDEQGPDWNRDRQRETGIASAGAEVQQPVRRRLADRRDRREAVDDVSGHGGDGIADRRQVDAARPGQQEAEMVLEDRASGRLDRQVQARQTVIQSAPGGIGQLRKVPDMRRERFTFAGQVPLLGST